MASGVPKGWEKDSDKLFIHETGIRITRMMYKGKDGWYLVPVDLDAAVVEFEPTPEGRDKAFEAFAKGALVTKPEDEGHHGQEGSRQARAQGGRGRGEGRRRR
jgi:hypothetical protein